MNHKEIISRRLREEDERRINNELSLLREELKQRELQEYERKMKKLDELKNRFSTDEPSIINRVLNTEEKKLKRDLKFNRY